MYVRGTLPECITSPYELANNKWLNKKWDCSRVCTSHGCHMRCYSWSPAGWWAPSWTPRRWSGSARPAAVCTCSRGTRIYGAIYASGNQVTSDYLLVGGHWARHNMLWRQHLQPCAVGTPGGEGTETWFCLSHAASHLERSCHYNLIIFTKK